MMHARSEEGPEIAAAAMLGARANAGEDEQALYFNLISNKLSHVARRLLKEKLMEKNFDVESVFSRHWKRVGRAEGRQEGRLEGREEGRERLIQSVSLVLDARSLKLSTKGQQRLSAVRDLATLTELVRRAAVVDEADDLFAEAPAPRTKKRR